MRQVVAGYNYKLTYQKSNQPKLYTVVVYEGIDVDDKEKYKIEAFNIE